MIEQKRKLIDPDDFNLTVETQCELLGLSRSTYYREPVGESLFNLRLMERIDRIYTDHPYYGSRRIIIGLKNLGIHANRKRVSRLMELMGIEAIYPKPRLSLNRENHRRFPYLLKDLIIDRPCQVWSTDITYIPMPGGHMYLAATMDWYSRFVVSWMLSDSLEVSFCLDMLEEALSRNRPEIFNTDQGTQFTSDAWIGMVEENGIKVSMDGRGRCFDNIFVERLWRTVKYEDIYIRGYDNEDELRKGLAAYFEFYNKKRPHQSLGYKCPEEVHGKLPKLKKGRMRFRHEPSLGGEGPRGETSCLDTGLRDSAGGKSLLS